MKNKILKIAGTVFCAVLSIIFVLMSVAVPFYYSITALTKPKTITEVVQSVDYKTVIKKTTVIETALKQSGITPEKAEEFMKSEEAGEIIELYTDEATEILLNIPKDRMFDVELIKKIAEENLDDFVKIAEENTGKNFSEKKIKKNVDTFIEKNERQIEEAIPVIETTRKVVKTVHESKAIEKTLSTKFAIILSLIGLAFFAVVITIKRTDGLLWLCVDCMISSIILAAVLIFQQSNLISKMALKLSAFNVEIIESAVSVCGEKIAIAFGLSSIFTFAFVACFLVIKGIKSRKAKKLLGADENNNPSAPSDDALEEN